MDGTGIAYTSAEWSGFFSTEVGASATLTGLLFVAVSINLSQIISNSLLTARTAKALSTLAGVLITASLCLTPGQPERLLGWELLVVGALFWAVLTVSERGSSRDNIYMTRRSRMAHVILTQSAAIPVVVCGVSLLIGRGGGLYWMVAGVIVSFAAALLDAWVLLIEIQR